MVPGARRLRMPTPRWRGGGRQGFFSGDSAMMRLQGVGCRFLGEAADFRAEVSGLTARSGRRALYVVGLELTEALTSVLLDVAQDGVVVIVVDNHLPPLGLPEREYGVTLGRLREAGVICRVGTQASSNLLLALPLSAAAHTD